MHALVIPGRYQALAAELLDEACEAAGIESTILAVDSSNPATVAQYLGESTNASALMLDGNQLVDWFALESQLSDWCDPSTKVANQLMCTLDVAGSPRIYASESGINVRRPTPNSKGVVPRLSSTGVALVAVNDMKKLLSNDAELPSFLEIIELLSPCTTTLPVQDPTQFFAGSPAYATAFASRARLRKAMRNGLQVKYPAAVSIEGRLIAGKDVVLEGSAVLVNTVKLGNNARIANGAVIHASNIGSHTRVGASATVYQSQVGDHCQLGSHNQILRSTLGNNVQVGFRTVIEACTIPSDSKIEPAIHKQPSGTKA